MVVKSLSKNPVRGQSESLVISDDETVVSMVDKIVRKYEFSGDYEKQNERVIGNRCDHQHW